MQIERATSSDWLAVAALVVEARLPVAGLDDQFPGAYAIVRQAEQVVGVAGLQAHGRFGLLRSLAVREGHRGVGVGRALVSERLAAAQAAGLEGVYLLTVGAASWFARLGFETVGRSSVPSDLLASPEFLDACPISADCMRARPSQTGSFR